MASSQDSIQQKNDVTIIGGGIVGLSIAIALAQDGISCVILEKQTYDDQIMPSYDGRVSAIAHGSERILTALGVFKYLQNNAEPILDIRVADQDSTAHVHYNYKDVGNSPMGHMIENHYLRLALLKRVRELKLITVLESAEIQHIYRDSYGCFTTLTNGLELHSSLILAADGKRSETRNQCGITTFETSYNQTAIVCTIEHTLPHEGLALERFLPVGPFASLPMQQQRSCIVWSETPENAPHFLALSDDDFSSEIQKRLGNCLGDVRVVGKRFSYPLSLILAKRITDTRLALIGDAAHAIHPIAGQGVNVGFRDVAVLSELIIEAKKLGLDIGSSNLLDQYQKRRRFDIMSMGAITDGITRLFSNDIAAVKLARDTGLSLVNITPPLKRLFMKHAMGLIGNLPKMMKAS